MKRTHAWTFAAVALLAGPALAQDPSDISKLTGTYTIESGEKSGKPIPQERLRDTRVAISATLISTLDRDEKELYVASYELDQSKEPWRIQMTAQRTPVKGAEGTKTQGLIMVDGDTVKLIYTLPGGEPPTEFRTGENQQMFVLKRKDKEK